MKQAQMQLSKLVKAARGGQKVYLTLHNERVVELVPVRKKTNSESKLPGYGMFRGELTMRPDWNTQKARDEEESKLMAMLSDR